MNSRKIIVTFAGLCMAVLCNMQAAAQEKIIDKKYEYESFEEIPERMENGGNDFILSEIEMKAGKYTAFYEEKQEQEKSVNTTSRFAISYYKEVQVTYSNFNDVQEYYSYSEYSNDYKTWCSAVLRLKSLSQKNGQYIATYTGYLSGNI